MDEKLIFGVFPSSLLFITTKVEKPYVNQPELYFMNHAEETLEFKNAAGLTAADELPRLHETETKPEWETLSRIYVEFFWGTSEGCLCSQELGAEIVASWVKGQNPWHVKYDKGGGYFTVIPGGTVQLEKLYSISIRFNNLICDAIAGMTEMRLYIQNVPGMEDFMTTIPLFKQEPLEIVKFAADSSVIKKKGTTTLRWEVRNANECSLSGYGSVQLKGQQEVTLTQTTSFCLKASNTLGQNEEAWIQVEVSDGLWTMEAKQPSIGLPCGDADSGLNRALFEIRKKLYIYAKDCFYESSDGLSFQVLPAESGNMKEYSMSSDGKTICLFGMDTDLEKQTFAVFGVTDKIWKKWGFPYEAGQASVIQMVGEDRVYAAVLFEGAAETDIYVREYSGDGRWKLASVFDECTAGYVGMAFWEDKIWLAMGGDSAFSVCGTADGWDWTESFLVAREPGKEFFWLLSHRKGLFLITHDGIYGKRDSGGFLKESVIPEGLCWEKQAQPFVGIFGNKIWFVSNEGKRSVWSYSL